MKRKYLSALLMGVLTVTSVSTFTSCKDYDSDISNLQGQVDKAALATDVQSLKTQVETAAANASTAADEAKKAIDAAAANSSAIENLDKDLDNIMDALNTNADAAASLIDSLARAGKVTDAAIQQLQADNKAAADSAAAALAQSKQLSEELEKAIAAWGESKDGYYTAKQIDAKLDQLAEEIAAATDDSIASLKKTVSGYTDGINALYTAVTGVSLVVDEKNTTFSQDLKFEYGTMKPGSVDAVQDKLVFGEKEIDDMDGTHSATPTKTYTKGDYISFALPILVRVNPVNANLTKDMVKLVNSKGETLDDLIEVTKVEKYDELLTKGSSIGTGLWKITVQPKAGINVEKVIPQKENTNPILHAVAINNTAAQAETAKDAANRYVVSNYGLTVDKADTEFVAITNDDSNNANVKFTTESGTQTLNTVAYYDENGELQKSAGMIYAKNGEDIEISFEDGLAKNIEYFYVVRDDMHAGQDKSGTSEINAWNSYQYDGTAYGKIVAVEKGTNKGTLKVTIPEGSVVGDEIQFRLYAVNYNGTYYQTKGNAFRVYVGAETDVVKCEGNANFEGRKNLTTGWQKITGTIAKEWKRENYEYYMYNSQYSATSSTAANGLLIDMVNNNSEKSTFKARIWFAKNADGDIAKDNSEIKYFKVSISSENNIKAWIDNGIATCELKDVNKESTNKIKINLTKVMPDVETAKGLLKYKWRALQLVDGVYDSYMYPSTTEKVTSAATEPVWTSAATYGFKAMATAIDKLPSSNDLSFVIANAAEHTTADANKGKYVDDLVVSGADYIMNIPVKSDLIDNKTKHETTIYYDFGNISSTAENNPVKIAVEKYNTIFSCPLVESAQTLAWKKYTTDNKTYTDVDYFYYGTAQSPLYDAVNQKDIDLLEYITVSNKYDSSMFGPTLADIVKKSINATIEIRTKTSGAADYFTATITNKEGKLEYSWTPITKSAPQGDVDSWFVVIVKDAFGHTHEYKVPFTVKKP